MTPDTIIEKLKTGDSKERNEAKAALEKLWRGKDNTTMVKKLIKEVDTFESIRDAENKAALVGNMKWALFALARSDFESAKRFVITNLQHQSGKVRKAAVHAADYLIMSLYTDPESMGGKEKLTKEETKRIERDRARFVAFIEELETLHEKHHDKKYDTYEYITNLPPSPYKSIEMTISRLLDIPAYQRIYTEHKQKKGEYDEPEIPTWMDCTWRRVPCGKEVCHVCGDEATQIPGGEGHVSDATNSPETIFEEVAHSLEEALTMVRKHAEEMGIDITGTNNIIAPPKPKQFLLYRKVEEWHEAVHSIVEDAITAGSLWIHTEAAADLFWYTHVLSSKVYRQLCNRWSREKEGDLDMVDYDYTKRVLQECLTTLQKSLAELSLLKTGQKGELMLYLGRLKDLEKQILEI